MMIVKRIIKKIAYEIAPRMAEEFDRKHWLCGQARKLGRSNRAASDLAEPVAEMIGHPVFPANQKRSEILGLLAVLREDLPVRVCEIGAAGGGTLFLFCQVAAPDARFLSLDMNYQPDQISAYPKLARPGQSITCLRRDSHLQETLRETRAWLKGNQLDFLFIDGDHSFEGASSDLEMFGPLVRPGGLVAMHDIHPDFRTLHGVETGSDVGEVPRLWESLRSRYSEHMIWIEDMEQDGYGIGAFRWSGSNP